MQEAGLVDGLDAAQYLRAKTQHGAGTEAAAALTPPQFGQVATLDRHHHVVEALVATAADEAAHVLAARHHCKCVAIKNTQSHVIAARYHCMCGNQNTQKHVIIARHYCVRVKIHEHT